MTRLQSKNVVCTSGHKKRILLELSHFDDSAETCGLFLLNTAPFHVMGKPRKEVSSRVAFAIPLLGLQLAALAHRVVQVIGLVDDNKTVFLDTKSWVCSADPEIMCNSSISYARYFFVPYDWLSGIRDVICAVAQQDNLFTRNSDLAIVKGEMGLTERVDVEVEAMTDSWGQTRI
ncbi:hypothetical protein MMC14_010568 [Varicellaria rhodocarpa]|nr:hypothetical protein [Varicellaria rhodocarpa]